MQEEIATNTLDEIGKRIKELRKKHGDSQEKLCGELHVSRKLVDAWENGARPIRCDDLINLSRHYHVSADYILGMVSEDNSTDDEKLRMVSEYTGLSNAALNNLRVYQLSNPFSISALNSMLELADCWPAISENLRNAISSMIISKASQAEDPSRYAEALTRIQAASSLNKDCGKTVNLPDGTVLLSAGDASAFYREKAKGLFSLFLDAVIDRTAEGGI